jgi:hypothetical protein
VCVLICMYVCVCVCMYAWHVCMYVCMYVRIYVCMYVRKHRCAYAFTLPLFQFGPPFLPNFSISSLHFSSYFSICFSFISMMYVRTYLQAGNMINSMVNHHGSYTQQHVRSTYSLSYSFVVLHKSLLILLLFTLSFFRTLHQIFFPFFLRYLLLP